MRSPLPALAFGLVVGACGGDVIDDRCFIDPAPVTSRTNVIAVGDTVTFHATLGSPLSCLPSDITEDYRWSSSDTLIARIDSLTGLAEGVAPGDVSIVVRYAQHRDLSSGSSLQVVSPTP